MLVRFTKGSSADTLTCVRPDGSTTGLEMPRQGILPHEAFHFVIESTLGWRDAFFGRIAEGRAADHVQALLHGEPVQWSKIAQGLQAEALIECLETEQWGGRQDPADFAQKLVASCRRRSVPPPEISPEELNAVRTALRKFGAAWRPLGAGASLERTF
ncbi:MAG TPA: hypothetical protein VM029_09945 [Opitutaceae bacterium]|nr:hypothetical protein [Opitutaceae bacterium]